MALILLVEDENLLRWGLKRRLERAGHSVHEAADLATAEEHLRAHRPDFVLLDIQLPDGNGLDFLETHREELSESIVVVVTGSADVRDAVRAMKLGSSDLLPKPVDPEEIVADVDRALLRQAERIDAEEARRRRENFGKMRVVAESPAMRSVLAVASQVAASSAPTVLIQGETGVGKDVLARYVHSSSPRAAAPFQAVNCAALTETLVESELFGHEKGAFTDAKVARKGLFELAQGGTLVLDEIGELPPRLQAMLLRVLEERTVRRLGGAREISVDVRVLALTNRNLEQRMEEGAFRRDLFYRLAMFPILVPPLRERPEDIVPLANLFLQRGGSSRRTFTSEARERLLLSYGWPGNVRELRNVVERAAILESGDITPKFLSFPSTAEVPSQPAGPLGDGILHLPEAEFLLVQRAMRATSGNQSRAAELLGVSRYQLRYLVKKYRAEGRWPETNAADGTEDED